MSLWGKIKKGVTTVAKAATNPLGTAASALGLPAGVQAALNPVGYLTNKGIDAAGKVVGGIGGGGPDPGPVPGVTAAVDNLKANDTQNRALYDQLLAERAGAGKFAAPQVQTQDVAAPGAVATQQVTGATINDAQGQQIRGRQTGYLDSITDRMNGKAPSVAQAQYNQSQGDIARTGLGIAGQARGVDAASARRAAILSSGDQMARAGQGAALLRAKETTDAAGQLGSALEGVRGTDTATAVHAADLKQAADVSNQTASGVNDRFSSGAATDVATGNANRNVAAQGANATNALAGNAQNVGEKAGLLTGAQTATGQIGASGATAANVNEADAQRVTTAQTEKYKADQQLEGAIVGGAAAGGAGLLKLSDERAKKDIHAAPPTSFLDHLVDKEYEYKNSADGPGTREGVMAQDLEKSDVGRGLVHTGPDGMKRVDTAGLTLALAGAVARMRREMKGRGEAR